VIAASARTSIDLDLRMVGDMEFLRLLNAAFEDGCPSVAVAARPVQSVAGFS
jgi:hypothetical protein